MKNEPFFSIVIPTFNRADLIVDSIESVVKQTFSDWELIVVDDGSTDNTAEVIANYSLKDSRIKYLNQVNSERSVARNNGILNSTGKYVCFLDSDDFYLSNRLELLFQYLEYLTDELGFYYTAIAYKTEFGNEERKELSRGDLSIFDFILQAVIGTPQVIISRKLLLLEQFNPSLTIGEDMELWLRLAMHSEMVYIPNQATVVATEHDGRSVNFKFSNAGIKLLETLNVCFHKHHPGLRSTIGLRDRLLSNTFLSIFKYWFYQENRFKSIFYLIKSIFSNRKNDQTKYKINLLIRLCLFQSFDKIRTVL